jgi:hypothetical protein
MSLRVGVFLYLPFTIILFLVIMALISYCFPHLLSTNHKCIHPYFFLNATQPCCSEAREEVEFFDEEF